MNASSLVTISSGLDASDYSTVAGQGIPSAGNKGIIILGIELFLILFGNGFLLAYLWRYHRKKPKRMHLLMMHVAIADLAFSLCYVLPTWTRHLGVKFQGGNGLCKFYNSVGTTSTFGSMLIILFSAFDRFEAVTCPIRFRKRAKAQLHARVAICWVLAFLLSLPEWILFEVVKGECYTRDEHFDAWKAVATFDFIILFVIPIILLAFFYGKITWKLTHNYQHGPVKCASPFSPIKFTQPLNGNKSNRSKTSRFPKEVQKRTIVMTLVILITYVVCWMPYWTLQILYYWWTKSITSSIGFFEYLGPLSACSNPWIYLYFSAPRQPSSTKRKKITRASSPYYKKITNDNAATNREDLFSTRNQGFAPAAVTSQTQRCGLLDQDYSLAIGAGSRVPGEAQAPLNFF